MVDQPTVGFIGLGAMGQAMAGVLVNAGFETKGYDVNPAAVEVFVQAGGIGADTIEAVSRDIDLLYLMVVNAAQVDDVLFGAGRAVDYLPSGCVVVVGSTIPPGEAQRIAAKLAEHGFDMIDAPVSGGVAGAKAATLAVMASGSAAAFERAKPVFDVIGGNVFHLGETVGQGSTVKVINQLLCGVQIAAAAEAIALGVKAGVDADKLYEVIMKSAGKSYMFETRVPSMSEDNPPVLSAVDIFVKDLGIVLDTGRENIFPLPLASAAHQLFVMASAAGYGRMDDSQVVKVFEQLTGIKIANS